MTHSPTESQSDYSGLSSGSKQGRKFKNGGASIAVSTTTTTTTTTTSGSVISRTAQMALKMVPKNGDASIAVSTTSSGPVISRAAKMVLKMAPKKGSTSITVSSQMALKMVPKNLAKKALKRRADEDEGVQNDPVDRFQTKVEAQRECSRVSAARARRRLVDLEETILTEKQKTNDILRAQIDMLRDQNR
jgi:hypothetical protein